MQTVEEDFIEEIFMTTTHHYIMFFTNFGKVYRLKAYEIPEAGRTARGTAIINLMQLQPGEKITAVIPISEYQDGNYLFMATKKGIVKKTHIREYANIRKTGLSAIHLREDDELIEVKKTAPKELSAERKKERLAEMIKAGNLKEYEELIKSVKMVPSYVSDICEKFILSLCLVLSIAEGRMQSEDMPPELREKIRNVCGQKPIFVLVITQSKADWVCHIQDALNLSLRKFEKTNHIKVIVLTAEQAKSKGLVHTFTPMPVS